MSIHDQLIVYKYDNETIMELPRNIVADSCKKLLFVANDKELYNYKIPAKKKCTHEHAFRGTCLTCGEENVG